MSSTLKQAVEALKSRVADAYTAVQQQQGVLPLTQDTAHLPNAIMTIPVQQWTKIYMYGGQTQPFWYYLCYNDNLPIVSGAAQLYEPQRVTALDCVGLVFHPANNTRQPLGDTSGLVNLTRIANLRIDNTVVAKLAVSGNDYTLAQNTLMATWPTVTWADVRIDGFKVGDYYNKSGSDLTKWLDDADRVITNTYNLRFNAPLLTTLVGDRSADEVIANGIKCFNTFYPANPVGGGANQAFRHLAALTRASIVSIFLSLGDASARIAAGDWLQGSFTLTLPTTWADRVTDADKAIATDKGWVLNFTYNN